MEETEMYPVDEISPCNQVATEECKESECPWGSRLSKTQVLEYKGQIEAHLRAMNEIARKLREDGWQTIPTGPEGNDVYLQRVESIGVPPPQPRKG